jgi:diacylglycerol O-acyltransferase / wax synthase
MALMPLTDSMFLTGETRDTPMHVGGLQVFELPDDAAPSMLRDAFEQLIAETDVAPLFRRRPYRGVSTLGQWAWHDDPEVDLEHHVRHSALPGPGRVRELLALVSRLHSTLLDRQRPLWELHLIEGLEGNRFAVYTKLHHALMDGISGARLLQRSLSTDPDGDAVPAFWTRRPRQGRRGGRGNPLLTLPKATWQAASELAGLTPRMLSLAEQALRSQAAMLPGQAPRSMLNVSITGSRRYAAQDYSMEKMRLVAKGAGVTLNDVLLAMSAGALRAYLLEHNALPGNPLVAMTPVSLRREGDDDESTGNAVGAILANLATDVADPEQRLTAVAESTRRAKAVLAGLSPMQAMAVSAGVMLPMAVNSVTGLYRVGTLPFNIVISNVPGPKDNLYLQGARLSGFYPISIPVNGQAMNITATSYAGSMGIGLTACRRSVPRVQHMLGGLDTALDELVDVVT